jgi:hypothetical protein
MTKAFEEGGGAHYFGEAVHMNPYNWHDDFGVPPEEYYEWHEGWWKAEDEKNASQDN